MGSTPKAWNGTAGILKQLGVGGTLLVVVLYLVFNFLTRMGYVQTAMPAGGSTTINVHQDGIDQALHQLDKLYEWHDVRDPEGVLIWYGRSLAKEMEKQTAILSELSEYAHHQVRLLERMDRRDERRMTTR